MINQIRVLVVEDDKIMSKFINEVFAHYTGSLMIFIEYVETRKEAQERLQDATKEKIDVVLLDLNLPNGRGLSVIMAVAATAPFTPIVIITGELDGILEYKSFKLGVQDWIRKQDIKISDSDYFVRTLHHAVLRFETKKQVTNCVEALQDKIKTAIKTADVIIKG